MTIKQILPADGWVAAYWGTGVREIGGGEAAEETRRERVAVVYTEPVTLWALYDDGEVHGLVNHIPDPYDRNTNKADGPSLQPPNKTRRNFLGYAGSEEEAKEIYDSAASEAYSHREGRR